MNIGTLGRSIILTTALLCFAGSDSAVAVAASQWPEVRPLGCFMNLKDDGSPASDFAVRLWRSRIGIIGIVESQRESSHDPPMGVLTDIRYDHATRKISFKSKLTDGFHSCREHKNVPSQILLSFQGTLEDGILKGTFVLTDQLHASWIADKNKIYELPRNNSCRLDTYSSIDIWWWYWEPVYDSRGPKW